MHVEIYIEMLLLITKKFQRKVGKAFCNAFFKIYSLILIVVLKYSFVLIECFSKINI